MRSFACGLCVAGAIFASGGHAGAQTAAVPVLAIAPDDLVSYFAASTRPAALGVYPASRDPIEFLREAVRLAPKGDPVVVDALARLGRLTVYVEPGMSDWLADEIIAIFGATRTDRPDGAGIVVASSVGLLEDSDPLFVLGIGARTPVLVVAGGGTPSARAR
ncbi:MAG TPA: hypothetical protein VM600_04375, partial [Actinomycetota bacterium]|nr:hypothetical protein [Actinomycetota bacterium]